MFTIGKFKNCAISDVVGEDPCYCQWFYNTMQDRYPDDCEAIKSQLDTTTIYLNFGKYKNKSLKFVKETDPKYIIFLLHSEYIKNKRPEILNELTTM